MNIALVNELKIVFDSLGVNVWEAIAAAKSKPFGFHPFYPGPGIGGHCIPIDPLYLAWAARRAGTTATLVETASKVNQSMPAHVMLKLAQALDKPLHEASVCVIGVAYKANVDDARESPAVALLDLLADAWAKVSYHDRLVPVLARFGRPTLYSSSLTPEFVASQDALVIVTAHDGVDYRKLAAQARLIVDTRNVVATSDGDSCRLVRA